MAEKRPVRICDKRRTFAVFVTVLSWFLFIQTHQSIGQQQPDTLDWKRYLPLELGNQWQYLAMAPDSLIQRYYVSGDTSILGAHYYFFDVESYRLSQPDQGLFLRYYVRYAPDGAHLVQAYSWDSLSVVESRLGLAPCPLDGPFNSIPTPQFCRGVGSGERFVVSGRPDSSHSIGGQTLLFKGIKVLSDAGFAWTLGSDVGILSFSADLGAFYELEFASVAGVEYGVAVVSTSLEPESYAGSNTTLHPNPAHSWLTLRGLPIDLGNTIVEIIDITGRLRKEVPLSSQRSIFVGDLESGVYFVRFPDSPAPRINKFVIVR